MNPHSESVLSAAASTQVRPGAQVSRLDMLVALTGLAFCFWPAQSVPNEARHVVGFLMGVFFFFLSVFRVSRDLQFQWAVLFVGTACATTVGGVPNWTLTFDVSALLAVVAVVLQIRKPSYRGVFWRQVNPDLLIWWKQNHDSSPR